MIVTNLKANLTHFLSHYNKRTEMIGAFGDMARVSGDSPNFTYRL